jgi:hypothetical protein
MKKRLTFSAVVIIVIILISSCGINNAFLQTNLERSDGNGKQTNILSNTWTWVSGSNVTNQTGVFGTKTGTSSTSYPGRKHYGASWVDLNNNLWIFGGYGLDKNGSNSQMNDLWKFDGTNWTWMSGSDTINQYGVYGTIKTPAAGNVPGARACCLSWTDSKGKFWLFGGEGFASGSYGFLNDLWKYDPVTNMWTWMSGSNIANQAGNYGTIKTPADSNVPGGRSQATACIDSSDNLWLFGGVDSITNGTPTGAFGDLWKYNTTTNQWTWVSGYTSNLSFGVFGTLGTSSTSYLPGGRLAASMWADNSGNIFLFAGEGLDGGGLSNKVGLTDFWRYNPITFEWTWINGHKMGNFFANYGAIGVSALTNYPEFREYNLYWKDSAGNFWIYGGQCGGVVDYGDLWKFDGTYWTWISGNMGDNAGVTDPGNYGIKGEPSKLYLPKARRFALGWIDHSNNMWVFGGSTLYNDLWKYIP